MPGRYEGRLLNTSSSSMAKALYSSSSRSSFVCSTSNLSKLSSPTPRSLRDLASTRACSRDTSCTSSGSEHSRARRAWLSATLCKPRCDWASARRYWAFVHARFSSTAAAAAPCACDHAPSLPWQRLTLAKSLDASSSHVSAACAMAPQSTRKYHGSPGPQDASASARTRSKSSVGSSSADIRASARKAKALLYFCSASLKSLRPKSAFASRFRTSTTANFS
mmetsp:Transcript_4992/g.13631  ORF Transcript_4992/g.13631 Transcript_4992/m.13631 type:complete len:222 (+) Transcript_4992:195-860(+)